MRADPHVIDRPPTVRIDEGDGRGGWAWLLTASGAIEAQLVRGVLEGAGVVPVALDDRDPSPSAWMFLSGNVNAPVRVYVPRSLLDRARLALLDSGLGPTDPGPPAQAPPVARSRNPWLLLVAALLLVVVAILIVSAATGTSATCVLHRVC